jgi:rhomboid protease GluP
MSAGPSTNQRPTGARLLASLLAVADRRQVSAFVGMNEARLAVVVLPDLGAGVAIVERGDEPAEALKARIEAILAGHASGVLHVVLVGGDATLNEDRALLIEADRNAQDPNRLGMHLLARDGRVSRVVGRRLGLLAEAARRLPGLQPLDEAAISSHNTAAQKRREEAAAFAAALEHRPQRAIRLLGAANILFYALEVLWGGGNVGVDHNIKDILLRSMGANSALLVEDGQLWRLVSHAFLHLNALHLIVNLIALFSFGTFLEGVLGWRRMVLLYGLSALAGGVASAFIGHASLSVGASGAVWGLIAAGAAITVRSTLFGEAILPPLIAGRLRPRLLGVLAVNLAFSLWGYFSPVAGARIDLWAHAGGGLLGLALAASGLLSRGLVPGSPPQGNAANPLWLKLAAGLVLAMLVGSMGAALATGQPWRPKVVLQPDEMA